MYSFGLDLSRSATEPDPHRRWGTSVGLPEVRQASDCSRRERTGTHDPLLPLAELDTGHWKITEPQHSRAPANADETGRVVSNEELQNGSGFVHSPLFSDAQAIAHSESRTTVAAHQIQSSRRQSISVPGEPADDRRHAGAEQAG